jgi:hypothetical protein
VTWPNDRLGDRIVASIDAADTLAKRLQERARAVHRIGLTCQCGAYRATGLSTQDDEDFRILRAHLGDAREEAEDLPDGVDDGS